MEIMMNDELLRILKIANKISIYESDDGLFHAEVYDFHNRFFDKTDTTIEKLLLSVLTELMSAAPAGKVLSI